MLSETKELADEVAGLI